MLARSWEQFGPFFQVFQDANADTLTWQEMKDAVERLKNSDGRLAPAQGELRAIRHMVGQKLKNGVLLKSIIYSYRNMWAKLYLKRLYR